MPPPFISMPLPANLLPSGRHLHPVNHLFRAGVPQRVMPTSLRKQAVALLRSGAVKHDPSAPPTSFWFGFWFEEGHLRDEQKPPSGPLSVESLPQMGGAPPMCERTDMLIADLAVRTNIDAVFCLCEGVGVVPRSEADWSKIDAAMHSGEQAPLPIETYLTVLAFTPRGMCQYLLEQHEDGTLGSRLFEIGTAGAVSPAVHILKQAHLDQWDFMESDEAGS